MMYFDYTLGICFDVVGVKKVYTQSSYKVIIERQYKEDIVYCYNSEKEQEEVYNNIVKQFEENEFNSINP